MTVLAMSSVVFLCALGLWAVGVIKPRQPMVSKVVETVVVTKEVPTARAVTPKRRPSAAPALQATNTPTPTTQSAMPTSTLESPTQTPWQAEPTATPAPIAELPESHHPCANNHRYTWMISRPGASQIRIHFAKLSISSSDYPYLLDKDDQQLTRFYSCDYQEGRSTDWCTADVLKLKLVTSSSGTNYDFVVDRVQTT